MVNQAKAISSSCLTLLCVLIALSLSGAAWCEEGQPTVAPSSLAMGARCTEDASCVIVGDTHMLEWKSPAPAKIVVVCIHGLGLCARAYKPLAREFSAAGIDGFGVNVRGFGPDRDKPERAKLNCVETVGDVGKLLTSIHRDHPDYKVFLVGESMGGALAIRIAVENPGLVDGVICSAPAWKLLKVRGTAVKGVFELFVFPGSQPGAASRAVMHQATTDPELTEHWLTDPSHKLKLTFKEATSFLSFISKTEVYAKQLTIPILVVQGLDDHLVSPEAVAKLVRDIPSGSKTFLIDGEGEHLLLEEAKFTPLLVEKLISWIKIDAIDKFKTETIEVLNDQALSPQGKRRLQALLRLAKTKFAVKWAGALRNVHQGLDFSGTIALPPLAELPHLYAVGPLEDLLGEVTIWDGKALISRIKDGTLKIDNVLSNKACFLVYAQARAWKRIKIGSSVILSEVDGVIKKQATKCGIKTNRPFPFLIEGTAKNARYHVMNRTDSSPPAPGPSAHEQAKVRFTIKNMPVQLLGFYSEHHQGIFTHHSSFTHVHVKTKDGKNAGHLEDMQLEPGALLLLPKGYQ